MEISSLTQEQKAELRRIILEAIPEKRVKTTEKTFEGYDRTNPRHRYTTGVDVGYNVAIQEVRNSLIDLIGGTEL